MRLSRILSTPITRKEARELSCGQFVLLSGIIYTARDAAHKLLAERCGRGEALPFPIEDSVIYYVGPTPEKPGRVIGSAGPTTSSRMDNYTENLIALGLTGMIGKGMRSSGVVSAMREYGAVYFGAIGGAGALLSHCVESSEVIAYEELGTEAIRMLVVRDMPLTVIIDSEGNDLYQLGRADYLQWATDN